MVRFRRKSTSHDPEWERIQDEVRHAKQWRLEQTTTQRDLVDVVSEMLFRADPIGIKFETNTDEYDAEAETIVIGLHLASGPKDVNTLAHETFVQWFDAETAGPPERYASAATEIWNLWQDRQGQLALGDQ